MPLPATLYRYRSLSGEGFRFAQDIFFRQRLFWPLDSQLNDPAEGLYRVARPLVQRADGQWYAPRTELVRSDEDVRVLSFSEDPKHPLMWAHYADSHRGICIGIRRSALAQVRRVRYPQRVPRLADAMPRQQKRAAAFLTKRAAWAYEREWRLVQAEGAAVADMYLPLGVGAITQVIFGDRTSADDRDWVGEWLRLSGCSVRLRQVQFSGAAGRLHLMNIEPRER